MVATLSNAQKGIGELAQQFFSPSHYGSKKTVSKLKQVLVVTTSKESMENSFEIVKDVENYIASLPVNQDNFNEDESKKQVAIINGNAQVLNDMLGDIQSAIFNDGAKIEIDDTNMITFLKNMKKALDGLNYCSDYLGLVLQVQNEKKSDKKVTSFTDLLNLISAA